MAAVVAGLVVAAAAAGWWYVRPRHHRVAIDGVRLDGERVLTVTVTTGVPPCESDLRVEADDSGSRVVVTARTRRESGTCPAVAMRHTRTITLRAPVGDRPVVDGSDDRTLSVGEPR